MNEIVSLRLEGGACPTVEVDEAEVRIGEAENLVRLTPSDWNVLVRAVRDGELGEV